MATAVPAGASSRGGTSTCRSGHLLPPPRTGEPTATSRVSRGSSSRRSEASEGAARGTDDAEGMGKKMVPAADDMGGRGGCYRGLSSSSYVEEAGLLPPRFIHCGPGRLMCQARSSYNYSQFVGAIDPTNGKFPKATEMENEVDEQDCQTAIVASLSPSAQDLDAESYGVFEATKPDSELKKPSATPRNIRIQRHGQPSVLGRSVEGGNQVPKRLIARSRPDKLIRQACFSHNYSPRVGAIDDIHEQRVPKRCSKHYSSVTTSNKFDGVPLRKCLTTSAKGIQIAGATKKVVYATTLGGGGGYGDPHPPPFYKCKVCCKRTAFSRLKCCHLVVCDHCGCDCDTEYVEDKKLQFQKDGQQSDKEKLPKVKFEGTDLFLWQPFSYPADLMLCMAKRAGCQLEYYFAPVHELMDSRLTVINTTVYRFHQFGRKTRSLKVTEELISRKQLH